MEARLARRRCLIHPARHLDTTAPSPAVPESGTSSTVSVPSPQLMVPKCGNRNFADRRWSGWSATSSFPCSTGIAPPYHRVEGVRHGRGRTQPVRAGTRPNDGSGRELSPPGCPRTTPSLWRARARKGRSRMLPHRPRSCPRTTDISARALSGSQIGAAAGRETFAREQCHWSWHRCHPITASLRGAIDSSRSRTAGTSPLQRLLL